MDELVSDFGVMRTTLRALVAKVVGGEQQPKLLRELRYPRVGAGKTLNPEVFHRAASRLMTSSRLR
jgi:hypothetical protein